MKPGFYAAAMIALTSAAFLPAQAQVRVDFNAVIDNAPPPPRFESVPQVRRGQVWAPGYWNWDGQRHVWIAGQWQPERSGYQYQRAEWVRDNNGWRLKPGGWVVVQAQAAPQADYILIAPPRPRHEWMPRPRNGYIWAPGHWEWRGQRHDWVAGAWVAERPGYVYSPHNWVQRDGRWYMEEGRWSPREGYGHHGDRDRDGIPDRREHDRDGVPNRNDHDRDGDGVPNRFDNHPDNPRRN